MDDTLMYTRELSVVLRPRPDQNWFGLGFFFGRVNFLPFCEKYSITNYYLQKLGPNYCFLFKNHQIAYDMICCLKLSTFMFSISPNLAKYTYG
jgi:hypothetical protein